MKFQCTRIVIAMLCCVLLKNVTCKTILANLGRVHVNELFSTKIEPKLFNWTYGRPEQFSYRASLKGFPDLPSWMRYMYSNEYYAGYLYGTPPVQYVGREVK